MSDELDNRLQAWAEIADQELWSSLLVGNGFSQNIWRGFAYDSLFETASEPGGAHLVDDDVRLFEQLQTRNFEIVLSALATSKAVALALDNPLEHLAEREDSIRDALIRAVHKVHIPWNLVPNRAIRKISSHLNKYSLVYSTNYDLLIYWSIMNNTNLFCDYFWDGFKFDITDTKVWGNKTCLHFLHGGLHLCRKVTGQTFKRRADEEHNLLDVFGTPYAGTVPLFISEGTAEDKLRSIYRSDYLSFVFSRFVQDNKPLVVFGHSLGNSDQHIVDAIGAHKKRPIAVSIRAGCDVRKRKAEIISALPGVNPYFFDAATHPLGAEGLIVEEPAA